MVPNNKAPTSPKCSAPQELAENKSFGYALGHQQSVGLEVGNFTCVFMVVKVGRPRWKLSTTVELSAQAALITLFYATFPLSIQDEKPSPE